MERRMSRYDIAIIGMDCIFPRAGTVQRYWQNILDGDSYFTRMPSRLWRLENFYDRNRSRREKTYTTIGAFIDLDVDFPFLEYRLPPKTLEGMDPAQLVSLDATRRALADAGIEPRSEILQQGITIIGASGVDGFAHLTTFLRRHRYFNELRPLLEGRGVDPALLERLEQEYAEELKDRGHSWHPSHAAVGNVPSSISNRLAQVFGIRGMNMTVDGACASSFTALDVACQALCAGDARVAVTGGCDLGTNPGIYVGFAQMEGLSISGHSCPFDHTADGLVIGEGVGILVLKRLEDALEEGDRIRAVIRGMGASSDGGGQAIYAPSIEGRVRAFKTALDNAGTSASEIQYVEAHATSTVVGDAVEYTAIAQAYGQDRSEPLLLGSVKQQIGHLKAAAGVAGLIKTVLAMDNATYPHMPRFTKLNPEVEQPNPLISIPTRSSRWDPRPDGFRVAAVTASGFGGVNYHVIVEQAERYRAPAARPKVPREMAVVAASCRVPGAEQIDTFWDNVTAGRDVFSAVDPKAIGWHDHLDVGPENERITTHRVGQLAPYDFNFLKHRIYPKSISQISPTQFLALDLGERVLEEAGLDIRSPKRIGVSVGTMHDDHWPTLCSPMFGEEYADAVRQCASAAGIDRDLLEPLLLQAADSFRSQDPPITEHTLPGWMTNVTAGRMANKLNLHGPNFTVDSACSSGLAALVPAMYGLMFGNVDLMISGGLNRQMSSEFSAGVCTLGAVAHDTPRPFDAAGQGFLIGEGGVFYLLKRLADARRDGDEIIAVIRSVNGSSEADSRSMVAPSELAMRRSIRNTLEIGGIDGEEIHVVDVHGSANPISDIIEARSLAAELRSNGTQAPPVQITAIKSHIGHLYGGSAASSMLSTIQALRTRTVPGIRYLETLRPELEDIKHKALPRKGTAPLAEGALTGAVNSLGLGGANYFAVLSLPEALPEAPTVHAGGAAAALPVASNPVAAAPVHRPPAPSPRPAPASTVVPSSSDMEIPFLRGAPDSQALLASLRAAVVQPGAARLDPSAWDQPTRVAIGAGDGDSLVQRLQAAIKLLERDIELTPLESQGVYAVQDSPSAEPSQLAFCFPGQGVHYIGMGRALYESSPTFKATMDRVDELTRQAFDFPLLEHVYGPEGDPGIEKALGTLVGAQTSLFALEMALAKHLLELGVRPEVMIGLSFGEFAALTAAGAWELDVGFQAVAERVRAADLVRQSGGSALGMMSLICSESQRDALLSLAGDQVLLTNVNAPGRYILSGQKQAVERTVEGARAFGAEAVLLPIGSAFHSPWMEVAREPFRRALEKLPCQPPHTRVLSTVTGEYVDPDQISPDFLATHLSNQLVTPVDLPREVNRLFEDGTRHFVEVGPRWAFTRMVAGTLRGRPHRACHSLHPKVGDVETFRRVLAYLTVLGHLKPGTPAATAAATGWIDPSFLEYLGREEPAVLGLLQEVRRRFQQDHPAGEQARPRPLEVRRSVPAAPAPAVPARAPAAAAPAGASTGASAEVWVERLRDKLVEATGYPADMLEAHLDLEADLGIDSVQRAEIWVALLKEHGLDTTTRPKGARTLENLARTLADLGAASAPSAQAGPAPEPAVVRAAQPAAPEAEPLRPAAGPATGGASAEVWVERLRDKLVEATGYPADMLEAHLDLEADLGIDSVQRAEIWVALLKEHGLDSTTRPRGARTLENLARTLAELAAGPAAAPIVAPVRAAAPAAAPAVAPAAAKAPAPAKAAAPAPAPMPAPPDGVEVWIDRLRDKLVEATGYPADMLEAHLDLEADLGIDSVQRAEIWVAMLKEHGLNPCARPKGERTLENLARTLAGLAAAAPRAVAPVSLAAVEAPDPPEDLDPVPVPEDPDVVVLLAPGSAPLSREEQVPFPCRRALAVTADRASSPVVDRLRGCGIEVMVLGAGAVAEMNSAELRLALQDQDSLIYLAHRDLVAQDADGARLSQLLGEQVELLFAVFRALAPVLAEHPLRVLVPVSQDGAFGASPRGAIRPLGAFPCGFVRALQRELPDCRFQLLDGGDLPWEEVVEQQIDRLAPGVEVGRSAYGTVAPSLAPLGQVVRRADLLRPGDLLLVTGGARGIVFECVLALASLTGARLLLTGRTPQPEDRPSWLDATPETIDGTLRAMELDLVRRQGIGLGDARRASNKARSQWEVFRNLERLRAAGVDARYEACDVSDRAAFGKLIRRVQGREKVRGVVHGAGVQRSRLIGELDPEAIALTLDTKLEPLLTLLDLLDWSQLKLLSAFGSIAGIFGNPGQTDYALANDLLGWLVQSLGLRHPGLHAQTVHWTAWTGTGMVTAEEEKRFAEAGLTPLDVEQGVRLFLDGLLGTDVAQLAAFNTSASFAAARPQAPFPLSPRPRARLVEQRSGRPPTARFSRARDLWLDQHVVRGEPVVPGTFVSEMFAEVAAPEGLAPARLRFRRPMIVKDRSLAVELLRVEDQLLALPRERRDLPARALHNLAFATCELVPARAEAPDELVFSPRELLSLHGAAQQDQARFYTLLDEHFSHALASGPVFRGIRSTRQVGDRFLALVTLTHEAVAAVALPGDYRLNPVLADMAVQVAAAQAMLGHHVMAIPWEIEAVRIFGASREREAVVVCRARELGRERSVADLVVREPDGRPIFALDGLVLRTIAAGDDDPESDTDEVPGS